MTHDEIVKKWEKQIWPLPKADNLHILYRMIAADEREKCAKVVEAKMDKYGYQILSRIARAIRKRGVNDAT